MAFKDVKNYNPYYSKMDPRVDSRWAINSNHMVLAVTHFKTYKEMLSANKSIADMKVVGLITAHQMSETTQVSQFFEIGNRREIFIPGKTSGRLALSSEMIESVNLLGGIYETIVEGMKSDPTLGTAMSNFGENVIYRPELNETYYENSDKGSGYDISSATNVMDPNFQYYNYGIEEQQAAQSDASIASPVANSGKSSSNGALLFSIADLRMKIKFGLCFLIFQNSRRITSSTVDEKDSSGYFQTTSPYPAPSTLNDSEAWAQPTYDADDNVEIGDKYTDSYRIMGGVFFENCLVTAYSRSINTDPIGPNYSESLNVLFSGTKNLQLTKKRETLDSLLSLNSNSPVSGKASNINENSHP